MEPIAVSLGDARARRRPAGRAALVALCFAAAAIAGCSDPGAPAPSGTGAAQHAPKSGDGVERHDVEPLTTRIPALSGIQEATWFSGTLGGDDVPGPSLYWIDAVVTLSAGEADELRQTLDLATASSAPDVVPELWEHLPVGDLLAGARLDELFSAGGWRTTAYLSATGDELVLVIVGE